MADAGSQHIDEITRDLACPNCEYNLRGLRGAVVDCPECGKRCDIAELVSRRWTKPWWNAPRFGTVTASAAWAYVVSLGVWILHLMVGDQRIMLAVMLLALALWIWLLARSWSVFNGQRGLWLALLAHAVTIGFIAGVVCFFAGLISILMRISDQINSGGVLGVIWWAIPVSLLGVVLIWAARRGERYIGECCIAHYLRRKPTQ